MRYTYWFNYLGIQNFLVNVTFWIFTGWKISVCPRTIICNNCEQNNLIGEILNAGDNFDDQEDYRFTGSYFKIAPTVIDEYTKKKFLNMQLENLKPMRNIETNDKQSDEICQKNLIDDKESDERNQISKFDE